MIAPSQLSYVLLATTLILAGWLHLGALLLASLFAYFALRKLYSLTKKKWIAFILFLIIVAGIGCTAAYFTRTAWTALPEIADSSIPSATAWAEKRHIELPFTDFETLKSFLIDALKAEIHYLRNVAQFAGTVSTLLLLVVIGIVVASSLFFGAQVDPYQAT